MAYINGNDDFVIALNGIISLNKLYPVGSIYLTVTDDESKRPAAIFGGTWERLKDRFLLGAGDAYVGGATGGAATVTLTTDQMPYHTHQEMLSNGSWNYNAVYNQGGTVTTYEGAAIANLSVSGNKGSYAYVGYSGNNQPHNNMPPYLTVYMWKRTA